MAKSLFSSNDENCCACCVRGRPASDGSKILCQSKGVVDASFCCRKYKYDPLKRVPLRKPTLPHFENSDFNL